EAMWRTFVKVIERPALADDDRFNNPGHRLKNRDLLTGEVNVALANGTAQQWMARFNEAGIPSGPILNMEEMFTHPQVAAREMLVRMAHPGVGEFKTTGLAVKLADTPGQISRPPLVGEHTEEVLRAHGYSAEELANLRQIKAIR
ncbi:MAG: CoA transferase, partial [Gammaproteobacteria bacterium]